jgi:Cytochrome P450
MGEGRDSWDEPQRLKRVISTSGPHPCLKALTSLQLTILHNMTELTSGRDYWTLDVLAQSLLGFWFAASHQPWVNLGFVVLGLCSRPECVELLQNEIGDSSSLDYGKFAKLPLLDSFIKETVRLNPLDTHMLLENAFFPSTKLTFCAKHVRAQLPYDERHLSLSPMEILTSRPAPWPVYRHTS